MANDTKQKKVVSIASIIEEEKKMEMKKPLFQSLNSIKIDESFFLPNPKQPLPDTDSLKIVGTKQSGENINKMMRDLQ